MEDNIFDQAADVLEKDGWCQGDLHRPVGGWGQKSEGEERFTHCTIGALDVVVAGSQAMSMYGNITAFPEVRDARDRVAEHLTKYLEEHFLPPVAKHHNNDLLSAVPVWNDAKGRTAQEVIDFLRWCGKQEHDG
ncbi:hypothetical protein PP997_gp57 [Gordonia phage BigChungus]|uniref:Uncharacterized protein n=2 Tax=Ponsvirus TaxID=3044795 RepID=A0AAE8BVA0_9CAUD|nr:hypothetical protein PP997_gp57 [Gordonia phage BigChungus]YP_010663477.1 hypothetical protein PP998_gp60 [Gordonia phage Vine]QNJ59417.1 hypothetical protein SEA_FEASTONYEET_57 [Gordonia phage Feastonyeet]UXE03297.1 hypothetical protein SEA_SUMMITACADEMY_57 [Gordonia phage SummitAcademy]QNJ59557.1 hypothetical protein SEA_BIGCHUNGUS_57 [Gordonia phage BigChungus]QZD97769.1 hypothetical protein SEA_VINE_60 [Gordonia phage Vine]